jgi:diguanylate cyclase (GGDEF)-like protein
MSRDPSAEILAPGPRPPAMSIFEAAVQNISEGLCLFDADRNLVICNQRYIDIYKLPPELTRPGASHADIVKYRLEHGMEPTGRQEFLVQHEELLRDRKADQVFVTLGNGRTIAIRHRPLADGGWVATHSDITDEIERAKQLELQSFRFEAALDNMTQGLCMFDRDKRLVVFNRRYAEMYNISPDKVAPGMELAEVLQQRLDAGNAPIGGANVFLDKRLDIAAENEPCAFDVEMVDGRTIFIRHQPTVDGGWVATHEDVTEQRRQWEQIQHLAAHDPLTDLPNRILFEKHLADVEARAQRREKIGVLCIDLDHFKNVNDELGHAAGDAALKTASRILTECVREGDVVARVGGDEFVVIAGHLEHSEDAALLARRIVEKISEPMEIEGRRVLIGASVGIAIAPLDGEDGYSLLKRADLAMYRAKAEGRGAYNFYQAELDAALQVRRNFETSLRNALLNDEFRLVFQPLLNLDSQRVCEFEALLRWQHPERGLLGPAVFIPAAEESGLIVPIGEWVLRHACRAAVDWPEHISLAVNLSPAHFKKGRNLVKQVKSALQAAGLAPTRLELEITESVILADDEYAVRTLHELKQLGVRIALDDFGTGYSSLSYLRRFPFDKIKIDRSFVHGCENSADGLAIVKAVIVLGRSLGMATTAEGVETDAQLEIIRAEGCTEAQGFLFSKPLPAKAAKEFAARLCPVAEAPRQVKVAG